MFFRVRVGRGRFSKWEGFAESGCFPETGLFSESIEAFLSQEAFPSRPWLFRIVTLFQASKVFFSFRNGMFLLNFVCFSKSGRFSNSWSFYESKRSSKRKGFSGLDIAPDRTCFHFKWKCCLERKGFSGSRRVFPDQGDFFWTRIVFQNREGSHRRTSSRRAKLKITPGCRIHIASSTVTPQSVVISFGQSAL